MALRHAFFCLASHGRFWLCKPGKVKKSSDDSGPAKFCSANFSLAKFGPVNSGKVNLPVEQQRRSKLCLFVLNQVKTPAKKSYLYLFGIGFIL